MRNTSGINARPAKGTGGVELDIEQPAGVYDEHNDIVAFKLVLDVNLESAYALAVEIINAANERRETKIADIRDDQAKWGLTETRTVQEIDKLIANVPGPFVMAPARKLTDEEKARR